METKMLKFAKDAIELGGILAQAFSNTLSGIDNSEVAKKMAKRSYEIGIENVLKEQK